MHHYVSLRLPSEQLSFHCLSLFIARCSNKVLYWVVSRHMSLLHLLQMTFIIKEQNIISRRRKAIILRICLFRLKRALLVSVNSRSSNFSVVAQNLIYFNYFTFLLFWTFLLPFSYKDFFFSLSPVFLFTEAVVCWLCGEPQQQQNPSRDSSFIASKWYNFLRSLSVLPSLMEFFLIYLLFFFLLIKVYLEVGSERNILHCIQWKTLPPPTTLWLVFLPITSYSFSFSQLRAAPTIVAPSHSISFEEVLKKTLFVISKLYPKLLGWKRKLDFSSLSSLQQCAHHPNESCAKASTERIINY